MTAGSNSDWLMHTLTLVTLWGGGRLQERPLCQAFLCRLHPSPTPRERKAWYSGYIKCGKPTPYPRLQLNINNIIYVNLVRLIFRVELVCLNVLQCVGLSLTQKPWMSTSKASVKNSALNICINLISFMLWHTFRLLYYTSKTISYFINFSQFLWKNKEI